MRVTNGMLVNNMMKYMSNNMARLERLQAQLGSGKKVRMPSDDPVATSMALKLRTDLAQNERYIENADSAISWLNTTESTLKDLGSVLDRVRELVLSAANGTLSESDYKKIADEVKELQDYVMQLGNTTYAGRYIFSGYRTNQPAFVISPEDAVDTFQGVIGGQVVDDISGLVDLTVEHQLDQAQAGRYYIRFVEDTPGDTTTAKFRIFKMGNPQPLEVGGDTVFTVGDEVVLGDNIRIAVQPHPDGAYNVDDYLGFIVKPADTLVYQGDNGNVDFEVGVGISITVNVQGGKGGVDIDGIYNLLGLIVDSLNAGVMAAMDGYIPQIDGHIHNVLAQRSAVGAKTNRFELLTDRMEGEKLNFTDILSKNEDADLAMVIISLKEAENVYRASLAAGARVIMPTLVDFLR
ncbi:MAG TPA: flagellar hook-associated protein FlgL [Clostridiales bacterium]|nr:flagellar hook-associated protein FlgL [Clostridiales bacterium]